MSRHEGYLWKFLLKNLALKKLVHWNLSGFPPGIEKVVNC